MENPWIYVTAAFLIASSSPELASSSEAKNNELSPKEIATCLEKLNLSEMPAYGGGMPCFAKASFKI